MKTKLLTAFVASGLMLISGLSFPAKSNAEVSVNINIPLPGLVVGAPPAMVVIPGTCAYYPPDVDANIFFYRGYWYRPYGGHWFISAEYNGPWGSIAINSVPRVLINLPPSYRRIPPYYKRMPYGMVRKHWRTWEEERHWDRYEDENPRGGHGMGRGMGMGRRWDD
ncbi:MAG TPA: hypothetical protein DCP92_07315 [Nitrospiraceae bacterium]|nr:hypothetical protein [Nitrospiraceae bacterium]